MAEPLVGGTFCELPGRWFPSTLGQRARNEPQLFQAAGIYFECFVRLPNHTSIGVPLKVKRTPKQSYLLAMLATEVTGMAPCSVLHPDSLALYLCYSTHPEFQWMLGR